VEFPSITRNASERVGVCAKTFRLAFRAREGHVVGGIPLVPTGVVGAQPESEQPWRAVANQKHVDTRKQAILLVFECRRGDRWERNSLRNALMPFRAEFEFE